MDDNQLIYDRVLLKNIPEEGRHITRAERRRLREQGIPCAKGWMVIRTDPNSEKEGTLMRPLQAVITVSTGISVKVQQKRYEKYGL